MFVFKSTRTSPTPGTPGVVVASGIELTAADLAAARRRDPAAVTRIYQAYAPALLRFFVAAVGDRHAAEDLTGTVFIAAIESLPGFRGEINKLGGWLFRIARHDLYDYRRRVARVHTENLDDVLDEAALVEDAATLGRSAAVVRSLQHRGIATLLQALEPVDQEPHHDHVVPSEDPEPSSP
jgi:DNA-directed RNA polymerase specialized sigma24 family protein